MCQHHVVWNRTSKTTLLQNSSYNSGVLERNAETKLNARDSTIIPTGWWYVVSAMILSVPRHLCMEVSARICMKAIFRFETQFSEISKTLNRLYEESFTHIIRKQFVGVSAM